MSKVLKRPFGCFCSARVKIVNTLWENIPFVGISHSTHLKGDTKYRYFGYKLEIGQQRKNVPPEMNQKIFIQKPMSAQVDTRTQLAKKLKEEIVFRGDFQW